MSASQVQTREETTWSIDKDDYELQYVIGQ